MNRNQQLALQLFIPMSNSSSNSDSQSNQKVNPQSTIHQPSPRASSSHPFFFLFSSFLLLSLQLPIYPTSSSQPQLVEYHTVLESHVGDARRGLLNATQDARQGLHGLVSKWIDGERKVESEYTRSRVGLITLTSTSLDQ